jgi:DNA polymerase III, alpha subunit
MDYELGIIKTMGFIEYILIVWDYINWCRTHDCWVGPGRGSAAGSRVCYCTGITDIDPVKYNLLFERFLNPERVSMPDIDVDFEYAERYRAIEYVQQKYGHDSVTQIVTFGTMAARGVIKSVGKALDFPYAETDRLAKMVPQELNITIDKALQMNPEFKGIYDSDARVHEMIDMAKRLEGLPNHTSVHAAGVVIYPGVASDYVPLGRANDGSPTAEYNMVQLEELGLLKMDFLGLRTLTVLKDSVKNIKASRGIDVDIDHIDFNDKGTLDFIGTGKTEGVFQLESAGMQSFMKELSPQSFEDIVAGISLYRPGPMDFIPNYIKGKNNPKEISYVTPELESILEPTYGCIVYQEQVMQIVQKLAGYTMGQADNIRRAMSKKKQYVIDAERQSFVYGDKERGIKGCVANGIDEKAANSIYDSMVDFAKYAFNKSHAAAYAKISVQTAWLKNYYPVEFMAALMTSVIDNSAKAAQYLYSCRDMGIKVLPPDINCGQGEFTAEGDHVRYGMYAIKSLGRPVIDQIIEERESGGRYRTLSDFIERTCQKELINKRAIENLIKAGACDSLDGTRKQMAMVYASIVDRVQHDKKSTMAGQMSLFDLVSDEDRQSFELKYPNVGEYDAEEALAYEKEVLGIYLSGHPLEKYAAALKKNITANAIDFVLEEESGAVKIKDNAHVVIGGMIATKTIKFTKYNQAMAFITIEDLTGTVEVIIFPRDYERYQRYLQDDAKIFVIGHATVEDEQNGKIICEKIIPFDELPKQLWLRFDTMEDYKKNESRLLETIRESDGGDEVIIYIADTKQMKKLGRNYSVNANNELMEQLLEFLDKENAKIVEKNIEKMC